MNHKPSVCQLWALKHIFDHQNGAALSSRVHENTIRSLRRYGWITDCFDPLALTTEGLGVFNACGSNHGILTPASAERFVSFALDEAVTFVPTNTADWDLDKFNGEP